MIREFHIVYTSNVEVEVLAISNIIAFSHVHMCTYTPVLECLEFNKS